MKRAILLFAILFFYGGAVGQSTATREPMRGLWVVRHEITTPEKIDSLLERARRWGITDLFVQVRGRGDAYYRSQYEPHAHDIPDPDFDPLGYLLSHTRKDHLRIHAWLNVLYVWSSDTLPREKNHVVNRRSDWLARPLNQNSLLKNYPHSVKKEHVEGLYVSPMLPGVQEEFLKILDDLLSHYQVDGIHLDYIRYPNNRFDLHPDIVEGFRHRYALDPRDFLSDPERFAREYSLPGYESFSLHWRKYLMNGLSDFVRKIARRVRAHSPHILVSAAVKPDIARAHWEYYQNWDGWLESGWLDFAVPMNYTPDAKTFRERLESYIDRLPDGKYAVGVALYNQSQKKVLQKLNQVLAIQPRGFVLFSYRQLVTQPLVQRFLQQQNQNKNPFGHPATHSAPN